MAAIASSIDMDYNPSSQDLVVRRGNKIVTGAGGRVVVNPYNGSLVLELEVIGTHFPALARDRDFPSPEFILKNSTTGDIDIDYGDGTGKHNYTFIQDGSEWFMKFSRRFNNDIGSPPTVANISRQGTSYYPVYFYQDLPLPAGTVDDFYPTHRNIKIYFNTFSDLSNFILAETGVYGSLPGSISRFRNLNVLNINNTWHLTGLSNDLSRVFGEVLILGQLGFQLGTEIPQFVLSSYTLEKIGLTGTLDLSSGATSSRLDDLLGDPQYLPNLNSFELSNCEISYQMPNLHKVMTGSILLQSEPLGFAFSPDLSTWHFSSLNISGSEVAISEFQRLLENAEIDQLIAMSMDHNQDIDIATNNTTMTRCYLGRNGSYGGSFPSFLSKLTVLDFLSIGDFGNGNQYNGITSWGVGIFNPIFPTSLTVLSLSMLTSLDPVIPMWFGNLTNLTRFSSTCWHTQQRMDEHIESFYSQPLTSFNGLDFNLYYRDLMPRPSGIYQFSNNPITPMEMIYNLVHDHNMIVTVTNVAGDGKDIYTP